MYKKYLIIASKQDKAGSNITTALSQFRENPLLAGMKDKPNFDFYLIEKSILKEENLDLQKIANYDFIIFASQHKSEKSEKTLSIHAPGNWHEAKTGGQSQKVCKTSALFQKQLFNNLNKFKIEYELTNYNVTLEATHHGPLIDKPCVFIEIGSTEIEWNDRRAGFVIAKTIKETIENFHEDPYNEIAIAIGGLHYCPNFNKLQLDSNVAISHTIPSYALPLTEQMMQEALDKTHEEVDFAVIDWKGMGTSEQRQQSLDILDKLYIDYKKTSEVRK